MCIPIRNGVRCHPKALKLTECHEDRGPTACRAYLPSQSSVHHDKCTEANGGSSQTIGSTFTRRETCWLRHCPGSGTVGHQRQSDVTNASLRARRGIEAHRKRPLTQVPASDKEKQVCRGALKLRSTHSRGFSVRLRSLREMQSEGREAPKDTSARRATAGGSK